MQARWYAVSLVVVATLTAGYGMRSTSTALADDDGNELQFSRARIYIEYNDTDEDVGVQVLIDGEPWRRLEAFRPGDEKKILGLSTLRGLRQQGLSEFFFESSEPSLADVPLPVFLSRFPAGVYEFEGETVDGVEIEGEAILSHVIPDGPTILYPGSPCADSLAVVDPTDLVVEWAPVTTTILGDPSSLQIVRYQVIVVEASGRIYDVTVPASVNAVTVPPEFFGAVGMHKVEVLAIDATGNQTISEVEFATQ